MKNIRGSITINSDSVVLDLNEKKLRDPGSDSGSIGILLSDHSNITIKNGYFDGFWFAISGSGGKNLRILNNSFNNIKYIAINLSGSNLYVRGNYIINMDFYEPKDKINFYLVGLNIRDTSGCNILNNVVSAPSIPIEALKYRLEYIGLILSDSSKNCKIQNNIFSNFQSPKFNSIALWIASGTKDSFLHNNLILNYQYGIAGNPKDYIEQNNLLVNVGKPKWYKKFILPLFLNNY
ncbi:hypothetical protein EP47_03100 [Legionella norrlandica]|uniref:Right handed beta helix domain-containing protein n=1 Tax=Legionella norrlandica TaxID=1498499 RepID=A0A0A2SVZ2_9GAMM|nr:right-handed parallel beta-helix repeat-containing protein [Legionella norrlandica]KGP63624.1 hypothetical protein EP47_03100 [Legionella norrlandica]